MKTLDEVIEAQKRCTTYPNYHFCYLHSGSICEWIRDALHYLKTYRENQHAYEENSRKAEEARERYLEAVKNCELAENKYRKLYEETSQNLRNTSQITCPKCHSEFVILPESNEPLSWDELKQMEGKPVWVEHKLFKGWRLVGWQANDHMMNLVGSYSEQLPLFEDDCGNGWQAYRKERTE